MFRFALLFCFAAILPAQLVTNVQAIPKTDKPPVVFLNGYQESCSGTTFANTFGLADQILQANGEVSLFFNNCNFAGKPSIETLGAGLGQFLTGLKYADGTAVETVDVVTHSMGGLILRSYLSGKQDQSGVFTPPADTHIRNAVLLASPNFGTGLASLVVVGSDAQLTELASGSQFVFDLGTWNQGTDDLHGINAVGVAGNGGTGKETQPGFDDGVVALTSASLDFYMPGRTRVVPLCHVDGGGLVSLVGYCSSTAKGVADIESATDYSAQIITSFFNGDTGWQSVGTPAEQDPFLSADGGLIVEARTPQDVPVTLSLVTAEVNGNIKTLNGSNSDVVYTDLIQAGNVTINANSSALNVSQTFTLAPGVYQAVAVKTGPQIARVYPAPAVVFPLSVAPRSIVSIYGSALSTGMALTDTQVALNGTALELFYVSPTQINALIPADASGLMQLTVQTSAGLKMVNVWIESVRPAVFTTDESGNGPAAALNAVDQSPVNASHPLHAGDYLELFVTGLGATTVKNGLNYASVTPTVTVGGVSCPILYAGGAPGFDGLDQIDCQIPSGITASDTAPLLVTSGNRTSNSTTLAIQ